MKARDLRHLRAQLAELEHPEAALRGPMLPALAAVLALVQRLEARLAVLSRLVAFPDASAELLTAAVLQASFPILAQYRRGHTEGVAHLLVTLWEEQARALGIGHPEALAALTRDANAVERGGPDTGPRAVKEPGSAYVAAAPRPPEEELGMKAVNGDSWECLVLFNTAVSEHLRLKSRGAEGRRILRRLMSTLDLSRDQAGRILDVTGETVRRWERAMVEIPAQQTATLTAADAALSRLLELLLPERLPLAIRRPAEAFGGERALDWILRGRIAEVADRYDRALMYQL